MCSECEKQLANASAKYAKPHAKLKTYQHTPGASTMFASNQGEITLYRCETCGSLIEYSGADRTEAPPYWVLRGQQVWAERLPKIC